MKRLSLLNTIQKLGILLIGVTVVGGLYVIANTIREYFRELETRIDNNSKTTFLTGSSGSSSSSAVSEVFTSSVDLTGVAPSGSKIGKNIVTGASFFVNNLGNWVADVISSTGFPALTTTFTPATLNNAEMDEQTLTLVGLVFGSNYDPEFITDLTAFNVACTAEVIANDTVKVKVTNLSVNDGVVLPTITLKMQRLN